MAHRPITVDDIPRFTAIIDARSPSEFALDHIPGSVNCPVLDDEERRIVGTTYKQQGAFEARRIGAAMVAANLARHLRERFADMPRQWAPLVYCWRGGLRSSSMVTWLRLVGWDAQQLAGGYKSWRRHVIEALEQLSPQLPLVVLAGPTGSAKTRVLHALRKQGEQVLDLEACAAHKGSVLGALPGQPQPSQRGFETELVRQIQGFDLSRPVYVEAESRKIGRISLPTELLVRLRGSPCIEIAATHEARLDFLLHDYAYLGDDGEALAAQLGLLKDLHSKETIARWQGWARSGELRLLYAELMAQHYDLHYARSQPAHLFNFSLAVKLPCDELSEAGIDALATRVVTATAEALSVQPRREAPMRNVQEKALSRSKAETA